MSRRPSRRHNVEKPKKSVASPAVSPSEPLEAPTVAVLSSMRVALLVFALLSLHTMLAVRSLVLENPTVDEVIHMPAGITYWQTGSFRLYHHNPPLVKLVAALPVLFSRPDLDYQSKSWKQEPPNKTMFAHEFMEKNANRYFELFDRARLLMPLFSIVGGLAVFFWSRALYGPLGGLLSLSLWVFCPNILAHTRLVTTDVGATSIGVLATFLFWRYLKKTGWNQAILTGCVLGLAELTKFSLILLYGLWPLLALIRLVLVPESRAYFSRMVGQGAVMVLLSVLIINIGFAFEGVGIPLGKYEFASESLTKPTPPGVRRPVTAEPWLTNAYIYRINRFRDTWLGLIPVPLPKHYLLGFDDQKLEAEGLPKKITSGNPNALDADVVDGYPVYLNGQMSQTSWWYYYLFALLYKVPEGTWFLVLGSMVVLVFRTRGGEAWFDEIAVLLIPAIVVFVMSVFTNINLGLRYVLPIFPYVYIAAGKLAPWALRLQRVAVRWVLSSFIGLGMSATVLSTLTIHPHYLAYFNLVAGGPSQGAEHLIDSNIDWGQDLINLRRWLQKNAPGERVGLAYFGQIHPRIFQARGEGFDWFLPPIKPGSVDPKSLPARFSLDPSANRLQPGLYAVSVSLVKGLPWRVYDTPWNGYTQLWSGWSVWIDAFGYFRDLKPVAQVGHSIWIYRVSPEDAARLVHYWESPVRRAAG